MNHRLSAHLAKQNIVFSFQRYGMDALNFMALGLFGTLILGLILKNLGTWLSVPWLVSVGTQAQSMMAAAIGVGVAYGIKAPPLVMLACTTVGLMGASPIGAFVAVIVAAECGKFVHRTTPLDIIVTPLTTLLTGAIIAHTLSPLISSALMGVSDIITWAMGLSPIIMSMVVAVVMGVLLTLPISSTAIAISVGLSGLGAGAATVGCAAHMIGFAVMSHKDNGIGTTIACGLGTSMIQLPNLVKNPKLWLPPILTGAILAPFATVIFGMQNIPSGAGMGTSGLVGQIGTLDAMGASVHVWVLIGMFHFILPAVLCWLIYRLFIKMTWIKYGDLRLDKS